jgi:1-acyl-sn-glycerol-3-phosphate acyltransferase
MDHAALHERAREKGANLVVYWLARAVLQPFFHVYFRMSRIGREHIPANGPVIVAANHRSFLDPFVIGTMTRRPMYYVAKQELFGQRLLAWILTALGAFPVDRGSGDRDTFRTATELLARGEIVLIFVEGTRVRPGALGKPRKGVGRLALETGAPVVPVAVIGTEAVRRGWRIRPHKVRIRAGRPLRFPQVPDASPQLAAAVTARIWPCVMLQWEWLGGLPPIRRAAVIGAGHRGTRLAICLARAGFDVDLGCRTQEQADALVRSRVNESHLSAVELPAKVAVMPAARIELAGHDLVCLALPAGALPEVLAIHGDRITRRSALMLLSDGLVPPDGTLPSAYVAQRTGARAVGVLGGPSHAADLLDPGARVLVASHDAGYAKQLAEALRAARLDVSISEDVAGVELAGCVRRVAALAAAAGAPAGNAAAAAAAAVVSVEVQALAKAADQAGIDAPAIDQLRELIEGRIEPEQWIEAATEAMAGRRSRSIRAA